ncbi:MAG: YhfC family glutamic-type intramembrane protease [Candidatus Methanosuratincola sp.]
MDLNQWLILGPSGMIVVGIFSIIFWKKREGIPLRLFLFGGLLWAAAIIPKLVMDYTITQPLYLWWTSSLGAMGALLALGLYIGLRTGFFECGATYAGFRAAARRGSGTAGSQPGGRGIAYEGALAVGIGFGAFEAIVIAFPSLVQMASIFLDPSTLAPLPPDQLQVVVAQLSQPTWAAVAAVWERVFAILAHAFATVLTYLAVVNRRPLLLGGAIAYKTALDAPIPILQATLSTSPYYLLITEAFVAVVGLVGLLGILNIDKIAPGGASDIDISGEPKDRTD